MNKKFKVVVAVTSVSVSNWLQSWSGVCNLYNLRALVALKTLLKENNVPKKCFLSLDTGLIFLFQDFTHYAHGNYDFIFRNNITKLQIKIHISFNIQNPQDIKMNINSTAS